MKAVGRARATRLFREIVRVGTPYQLLRAALAGPVHSSVLLDSANSVFVLDELHAYDGKRLGFILAAVRLWERLGGRVAVLSATLPEALAELLRATLVAPLTSVTAAPREATARHRVRTLSYRLTDPAVLRQVADRLGAGHSVLVVANNVVDAQELFSALAPVAREHGPRAAHLLHARFRRLDRSTIERAVLDRYRTGTPAAERQPGLVVATQVVEISLDVDFDVLFTSAAPLEALLQRFGRVNRVGARPPAEVHVCPAELRRRRGGGAELFADGVYEHAPTEAAWRILTRHDGSTISEDALTGWLDEVYSTEWGTRWRADMLSHRDSFARSFLTFTRPFDDRGPLSDAFDELFDGTEAILAEDRPAYAEALASVPGPRAARRLLAEEYLIPLPAYGRRLSRWDADLGVRVVEGDYSTETGLSTLRGPTAARYVLGELI